MSSNAYTLIVVCGNKALQNNIIYFSMRKIWKGLLQFSSRGCSLAFLAFIGEFRLVLVHYTSVHMRKKFASMNNLAVSIGLKTSKYFYGGRTVFVNDRSFLTFLHPFSSKNVLLELMLTYFLVLMVHRIHQSNPLK